jgi:hypothetical protein
MGATTVRQFTNQFFREECEGHTEEGREPPTYYVITNAPKFRADLHWLVGKKQDTIKQQESSNTIASRLTRILRQRMQFISTALERKPGKRRRVRVERVGTSNLDGIVDLIEIPIDDTQFNKGSALEDQKGQIILFRCSDQQAIRDQPWPENITQTDLALIHKMGYSSHFKESSLTALRDLFIDAREGTDLTAASKLLQRRETNLGLRLLRDASDYTLDSWVNMKLALQGEDPRKSSDKEGKQSYLDFAKDNELISKSDYAQAKAYMFCGNAAVHHNFLAYHRLSAVLFLHWMTDFVDRTIGFHRMPKSRENGTSFSERYEFSTKPQEYELRRAVFDQLRCMTWHERGLDSQTNRVYVGQDRFPKADIMKRAIKIVDKIKGRTARVGGKERSVRFNRGEEQFLSVMNFWAKEIRRDTYGFSALDAVRAAMFAHSEFYDSKDMDPPGSLPTTFHETDPNWRVAVHKKGMGPSAGRYNRYKFGELEPELKGDLRTCGRIAKQYSAHD